MYLDLLPVFDAYKNRIATLKGFNVKKALLFISSLVFALGLSSQSFAISAGDKAPLFKLPQLEGKKKISLKSLRGKVVYLDFWASWCGPCRQSLPMMSDIRDKLKKKGFEVLAVNLDEEPEAGLAFLKQFPVSFPVVSDVAGKTPEMYGLQGMPTSYLIDRKGKVQLVHVGFKKSDITELEKKITKLLKKK